MNSETTLSTEEGLNRWTNHLRRYSVGAVAVDPTSLATFLNVAKQSISELRVIDLLTLSGDDVERLTSRTLTMHITRTGAPAIVVHCEALLSTLSSQAVRDTFLLLSRKESLGGPIFLTLHSPAFLTQAQTIFGPERYRRWT